MPLPENIKPIARPSLRDEIYDTLLSWVIEGQLKPGEKILDMELAHSLGVSRTPVREAIRRLEDKNFVCTVPGRWTRVNPISASEVAKIYPVIINLEQLALKSAANKFDEPLLQQMARINDDFKTALSQRDPKLATSLDMKFHKLFTDAAGNDYLSEILTDLKLRFRRFEMAFFKGTDFSEASVFEHDAIIKALADNDIDTAVEKVRINWQMSFNRMHEKLIHKKVNV